MKTSGLLSVFLATTLLAGCCSMCPPNGPKGPEIVSASRSTETGHYAEVGVQFTSMGDFFALAVPTRWLSPIKTGGTLSWLNPKAWSEDAGRTSRILIGEAALVGGVVFAVTTGSDVDVGSSGSTSEGNEEPPPPSVPPPSTPSGVY